MATNYGTLGAELEFSPPVQFDQTSVAVTVLSDGRFIVVWSAESGDGDSSAIWAQFLNTDGTTDGVPFVINTQTIQRQFSPEVEALSDGGFAVVYSSTADQSDPEAILEYYDSSGTSQGTVLAGKETSFFAASLLEPSFEIADDGTAIVTYQIRPGFNASFEAFYEASIIAPDGTRTSFVIEGGLLAGTGVSDIALVAGGFVVAYTKHYADVVTLKFYAFDGTETRTPIELYGNNVNSVEIETLADGNFAVVWTDQFVGISRGYDTLVQVFSPDGTPISQAVSVDDDVIGTEYFPDLIALPEGGFAVVWWDTDERQADTNSIQLRVFDAAGAPTGDPLQVNVPAVDGGLFPQLAINSDGDILTVWNTQIGTQFVIRTRLLEADSNSPPTLENPLVDQNSDEDTAVLFAVPSDAFIDVDGDVLSYSATLVGGDPLPTWLNFDASTQTFSGTPPQDFNGSLDVAVTASDGELSASDSFALIINPVNDAPVIGGAASTEFVADSPLWFNDAGDQRGSIVIENLAGGGYVVAWESSLGNDGDTNILLQIFSNKGEPSGEPFSVAEPGTVVQIGQNNRHSPDIELLDNGNFVVVWTQNSQGVGAPGLRGRVFEADGTPVGDDFIAFAYDSNFRGGNDPQVVDAGNGEFWIIDNGTSTAGNRIYAQKLGSDGTLVGGRQLLSGPIDPDALHSSVRAEAITLANGDIAVAWSRNEGGFTTAIELRLFSSDMTALDEVQSIEINVSGLAIYNRLVALPDGGFVLSWEGFVNDPTVQLFGADYNPIGDPFIPEGAQSGQSTDLAVLGDGTFIVGWDTGNETGAKAQRYDSGGTKIGETFALESEPGIQNQYLSLVGLDDDSFAVTYTGPRSQVFSLAAQDGPIEIIALEDGPVQSGLILAEDVDEGAVLSFQLDNPVAGLTLDTAGDWNFDPSDPAYQALPAGEVFEISAGFTVSDEFNASDAGMFVIKVTGVNDAPSGTDRTITVDEDISYNFTPDDFGFADIDTGDVLSSVRIDTLPLEGILELNGSVLSVGDFVSRSEIDLLAFTPAANENGVGYASFNFSVSDGTQFDAEPDTIKFDINPVNDAPVVDLNSATEGLDTEVRFSTTIEPTIIAENALVSDVDSPDFGTARLNVGGNDADGVLALRSQGSDSGQIEVSGNQVFFEGVAIGVISGGVDPGRNLSINFNENAGADAVQAVIRNVTFTSIAEDPMAERLVSFTLDDGDGAVIETIPHALIVIGPDNNAPQLVNPLTNQNSDEDTAVLFQLPSDTFSDSDGDVLSYTANLANGDPLPLWLSFNAVTGTFSGTPPQDFNGNFEIEVTASDGEFTTSDNFALTIDPVNDAPQLSDDPITFRWSDTVDATAFGLSTAEPISLVIQYSAHASTSGGDGTTKLAYDPVLFTLTFGGETIQLNGDVSIFNDLSIGDIIAFNSVNAASGSVIEGYSFNGILLSFIDRSGELLSDLSLPDVTDLFDVLNSQQFVLTLRDQSTGQNISLFEFGSGFVLEDLTGQLVDQTSDEDTAVLFAIPDDAFTDVDGDALSYTATLAGGDPLPAWLVFDAATLTFSGTPPLNYNGALNVEVTASDGALSASDTFTLTIDPVNDAPVAVDDTVNVTEDSFATGNLLFAPGADIDVDGDGLVVTQIDGQAPSTSIAGQFGTLQVLADGSFIYSADADIVDTLAPGTVVTESFDYVVSDGELEDTGTLTVNVTAIADGITVSATKGGGNILGTDGDDVLAGGRGNDSIFGGEGFDQLSGDRGNDFLDGGPGIDLLDGGRGNDNLFGGPGDDLIIGGKGSDVMTGGPGSDIFLIDGPDKSKDTDVITDFELGSDHLYLGGGRVISSIKEVGGDTVIRLDSGAQVVLEGVTSVTSIEALLTNTLPSWFASSSLSAASQTTTEAYQTTVPASNFELLAAGSVPTKLAAAGFGDQRVAGMSSSLAAAAGFTAIASIEDLVVNANQLAADPYAERVDWNGEVNAVNNVAGPSQAKLALEQPIHPPFEQAEAMQSRVPDWSSDDFQNQSIGQELVGVRSIDVIDGAEFAPFIKTLAPVGDENLQIMQSALALTAQEQTNDAEVNERAVFEVFEDIQLTGEVDAIIAAITGDEPTLLNVEANNVGMAALLNVNVEAGVFEHAGLSALEMESQMVAMQSE